MGGVEMGKKGNGMDCRRVVMEGGVDGGSEC